MNLSEFIKNQDFKDYFLFFLGAFTSFTVSFIFFKLSQKKIRPLYFFRTETIIDKESLSIPSDFNIQYKGNELGKLVRSEVYFWNSGNNVIRSMDLVEKDKIRIIFEDPNIEFYTAKIINNTDKVNGFVIEEIVDNEIVLYFNYLEPKQGVKIEVLHSTENVMCNVSGKVIGASNIRHSGTLLNTKINSFFDLFYFLSVFGLIFVLSFLTMALFAYLYSIYKKDYLMIVGFFMLVIVPMILSPISHKFYTKSKKYPSKLDNKI